MKVVLGVIKERRFDFRWFVGTGGMPSSHVAGVAALMLSAGSSQLLAEDIGLGNRTNTIMQSAFFKVSGVIPYELAVKEMKAAIVKSYGSKGDKIVNMNYAAVDKGGEVNFVIEDSGEIRIFPEHKEDSKEKRVVINYDKHLFRNLIREYLLGGDIIEIKKQSAFNRKESKEISAIVNNLLNLEIIEEESNTISVQNLKSDMPLKKMIYRMYFLTKSMMEDLITDSNNTETLKGIIERDQLVGKFYLAIIMHQRELLTKRWSKEFTLVEILDLRLLIERIEQIGDEIKSIVKDLLSKKKKIRIEDIKFLIKKYEEAYNAYEKKDTETAKSFWDSEKSDKQRLTSDERLVRLYDHIKDITDLVI